MAMDGAKWSSAMEVQEARDKEVIGQCDDLVYRFKRYNAGKKLNLNFFQDLHPLPKGVIEEMVEAYKGKDADAESSSDTDSSSEEERAEP
ncbi:unnamed protein product [Prunus armeniaca]